ncbi:TPA: phage tail tape measure protein [Clostridioides difficile]|nr:phage tail tape measure protein [Clostridioides difficile]
MEDKRKRGGSVLHEYGVSLGDTVGMITATNEAIQNPEKVGNGLKSVAINLAGMKVSADDGTLSLNKTAKGLKEIAGITIYKNKDTGELKNMVQLLDELKGKWGELREDEQKGLAEAIAGKQQAAIFQSLMGNYETFKEIRSEFSQGLQFGSAEAENKQYLDSLAGRLNELKTIWADIFQTVFNSNTTYGFLDGLISVSNGINSVIKTLERLKLTTPALIGSFMTLKTLFSGMGMTNGTRNVARLINPLNMIGTPIKATTTILQSFRHAVMAANVAGANGANVITRAGTGLGALRQSLSRTSIGIGTLNIATSLLNGAMIGLATFAITKGIQWIDDTIHKYEKLAEKQKEVIGTTTSEISSLQQKKKSLEGISEEYNNLASKTEKTADETERFSELKQQIADIAPELVLGVDENNDPILNMSGNLDEVINKLRKAIEEKNKLLKSQEDELAITTSKTAPDTKKDLDKEKKKLDKVLEDEHNLFKNALSKSNFKEQTEALKKAYNQQETDFAEHHQKLLTEYEKYNEEEEVMQKRAINRLTNSDISKTYAKQSEQKKSKMNELVANMNWHDYSVGQQNSIISAFDKISESIPVEKLDQWNKKITDANINYQASGDMNQYTKELQGLANELQKLSGGSISADTWLIGLQQGFSGLDLASMKLHTFLKSYGSSLAELENKDSFAIKLKNQFDALNDFSQDLEVNGKVNIKLLEDIQSGEAGQDLPQQLKDIINGFTFGEDSQIEAQAQLALQVTTTLQNEGQLSNDVVKQLNDLFKGKLQLTDDILKNGLKISDKLPALPGNMVQALNEQFANAFTGDNAPEITPSVNGEKAKKELKELEKFKKDTFKSDKIVTEINNKGLDFAKKDLSVLKEQLDRFKNEDTKLSFTTDCADAFKDVNSLEEARKKISAPMSLKYDIDVDKKGLTEAKKVYDILPDNLKKKIETEVIGIDKLDTLQNLIDKAPNKKETIFEIINKNPDKLNEIDEILNNVPNDKKEAVIDFIVNNLDQLEKAKNVQEFINNLPPEIKKQLGIEVEGGENAEKTVNTVQNADGTKADLLVNAEVNGESQVVECIETLDKNGNKTYTPNLNPQVNNSEKVVQCMRILDEYGNESYIPIVSPQVTNEEGLNSTKQKMDELDNKTVTPTVQIKTEGETEVEQATNFIENTNPTKVIELSINNSGKDEIDNTKQKLDELNNEKATPTIEATGAEQASEQLNQLSQKAQEIGQGNYHINVSTSTEQGAKNISGLIARVKQFLALKVSTLVFRTETAQAAKNVSGLLAKVQSYVSRYGGKTIKTTFSALTATAAKNISGLIRKIESFKSNYAGKTFTTTFVTNKVTNSSGGGGGGNSSDKTNKTERTSVTNGTPIPANLSQPRTSEPAPISDETPVTKPSLFSRAVSRATSAFKVIKPKVTINNDTIDSSVKYSIELFKELENAISAVTNEIALLDKKMEHATGDEKIKYLQEQNKLFAQQKDLIKQQQDGYKAESNRLKNRLKEKKMGFKFDDTGNLTNYEEKLISIEKELDKLNSKSGDKENKKDESRKKELEETKKVLEEYIKVTFTELPKCEQEWEEYNNKIKEHNEELRKAQEEMWKLNKNSTWTSMYKDVEQVNNEIAMIDVLLKNATGDEQIELLEKKKELMAKKAKELSETTAYLQETQKELQQKLQGYGFTFRDNGDITNFIQHKNQLKKNMTDEEFKRMEEAAEGYLDLLINKIPDANKEIAESKEEIEALNKEIQDAYKDQLKEAQSLQEKIRDMYKKELEERLKEIDKETKAKIDSLKKQQDAYNDSRKEAKYKDDYEEQQDVISDLEKQIAIAERDSSLSGQKKLKDLQKQLKEEQKKLQDLVQDHVDDQVNDMYDKESDRLQEEADKLKEELEKKYSDENLVDLINEAISSGKFVGLDGEVKKLQDAIIEYINKYEDGMLAMGSVTKQEWLDKLKEGKETLEDINDILDELDLSKFAMPNYNPSSNSRSRSVSSTSSVNFNSPFFVVQGNVTKDTMKDLEKFGRDLENRVYRKIVENIKS